MTDRVVELWARHAADVPLEADEQAELRAALAGNDDFRAEAIRDLSFDRLLRARHRATQDADAFEHALFRTLEAERDATRFIRKVSAKLQGGDRRIPALVALAALVGLALLVSVPRPSRAPENDVPAGSVTVTPPAVDVPQHREPVAAPDVTAPPAELTKPDDTAREELEQRLAEARERDRKALDDLLRRSQDGPSPATEAAIGAIELVTGDAFVRTRRGRGVATSGQALAEGDAVQTGAGSARLLFADGTRAELGVRSELRADCGRLVVVAGQVTLRAPGRIVAAAPNGETTASGAVLHFEITRASTRLDVIEGNARFAAVDVPGGHFVLATGKREPIVRMREPDRLAYGCVQKASAASSVPIGRDPVTIRFRAEHTAAVPEVRLLFGGAASGSGGDVRVELRDGPRVLAAGNVRQPRAPSARPVVFDRAPAVEAGRVYDLVLTNPDPNPRDNWVSLRTLAGGRSEFVIEQAAGHAPAMELTYRSAHGRAIAGQPYAEVSRAVTIHGAQRVRETFTPRTEVTVTSVFARARVCVRLVDASCALIEEGVVDASGTLTFASPRTLRAGATYHVVLRAPAGERCEIAALAAAAGFKSPALFVDGHAQVTSGASWEDLERRTDFDWPLYFGVAPR